MPTSKGTLRTCKKGHQYYKSSDCPVCPICAAQEQPEEEFLAILGAPARRALQNAGIKSPEQLSKWSKKELMQLHGLGPSSIPRLESILKKEGLSLK
jgi:predicted RecB family nuclease